MKNVLWDCNVNFLALPTSNVLKDRRAKMGFAKMAALITKIVLDSTYAFKKDVSTLALWEKLADPTLNVRPETRLKRPSHVAPRMLHLKFCWVKMFVTKLTMKMKKNQKLKQQ